MAENRPFIHFWVQVKAGNQCTVSADGESASHTFSVDHLQYWNSQPVPVFAALVPTDWPVVEDPPVFIVDLVAQLLAGVPNTGASCTLHSNYRWNPGNRDDVKTFLETIVPLSSARLLCQKGVVALIPTPSPSYEIMIPDVPVARFNFAIATQIRRTAANSIIFLLASGHIME
ncbi:hypothetical protein ES705_40745 [subsurface metagenome]